MKDEARDYQDDVESTARGFLDDCRSGSYTSEVHDALHELIDGHQRVIYTWKAKMCVMHSANDGAHFDNFGADGAVDRDGINWSVLAYSAFMADVRDELDRQLESDIGQTLSDFDTCEDIAAAYAESEDEEEEEDDDDTEVAP